MNIDNFMPWTNPVFRWAGSKRKLLPLLVNFVPSNFKKYIEPFAGSACLFFAIRPKRAILSDINRELIQTYMTIKKHPRLVFRWTKSLPDSIETYMRIRKQDTSQLDEIQSAARFVYLNRHCFNAIYRTNRQGNFNVPKGTKTGQLPPESLFYRCSIALRSASLVAVDFEECLKRVKRGDFVYLDPPYAASKNKRIGEYGPDSFQYADIHRLIKCLKFIDSMGARFLFSYTDCEDVLKLLPKRWYVERVKVYRHIAGFACHRQMANEIIVFNL